MTHSPSIQTCTVKGVWPSLHSYIVLLCSALKMINFQTSVVKIPWLTAVPESLSPWQIWRLPICVLVVPMEPRKSQQNVNIEGFSENVANTTGILHAFNLMMLCSLSDFQNFRGIKPQRPPATLAKACMQARSKCSNTTRFQKKSLFPKRMPLLEPLLCVMVCQKSFASLLYSTNHLFAVYQFLAFCNLIVTFL